MVNTEDRFPVVIVGGGLAGLTAAVHLAAKGIPPLILEADSLWLGGRLSGGEPDEFEYAGKKWQFMPDHGVHAVWGGYVNMRATLAQFTETQLVESSGEEWINRWGNEVRAVEAGTAIRSSWLPAPFHYLQLLLRRRFWTTITPLDFLSFPGFLFSLLWTVGFDPFKEQSVLDGLTMEDYFQLWTPNLKTTFVGLGANLLAASPDDISLTSFIAALRFYTVLRRDSWHMQNFTDNSHKTIIQPLLNAVESDGGKLLEGKTVTQLEQIESGWRVIFTDTTGRIQSVYTDHVILATNPTSAERILSASPDVADEVKNIDFPRTVGNLTIRLWFSKSPREGAASGMFTGDFLPDNFFWLHRLYDEFKDWHSIAGGSVIEVHIYGSSQIMGQPDNNLMIESVVEVQRAFPELRGSFVHGVVRRNSFNHTVLRIPNNHSLWVETPWERLYACGDWIGYDTPSLWMERATVTGIAAANYVLKSLGKATCTVLSPPKPGILVNTLALIVKIFRIVFTPVVLLLRALRRRKAN